MGIDQFCLNVWQRCKSSGRVFWIQVRNLFIRILKSITCTHTIHLGFSLHSTNILRKIESEGLSFHKVMIRTKETLRASGDFGVAIFDNSQLIEQLKFQRNAKSSSVTLTTSRCFLKPMFPTNMDEINFGSLLDL